jgi:hypothetical protein
LGFGHICQKQGHLFDQDLRTAEVLIGNEDAFLNFPIASILKPDDISAAAEVKLLNVDFRFNSSAQKRDVLEEVTKATQSKGLSQTMTDDVVSVTDEVFTNAMFNAPFVDINTQKNPGINRHTDEVKLANGKFGRLFLASDENTSLDRLRRPVRQSRSQTLFEQN